MKNMNYAFQLEIKHIIDMKSFMILQYIHTNDHREKTMSNIHTTRMPKK